MNSIPTSPRSKLSGHSQLVARLVLAVIGMFAFGYALVPLYDVFCKVTGLNGKIIERAETAPVTLDHTAPARQVHLDFVTTVGGDAPLAFRAQTEQLQVEVGKLYTAQFTARNLSDREWVGQAIPSIAPGLATRHLKKLQCFCFDRQVFAPHETKTLSVRFYLDQQLPDDVKDMTLSYTFFSQAK